MKGNILPYVTSFFHQFVHLENKRLDGITIFFLQTSGSSSDDGML